MGCPEPAGTPTECPLHLQLREKHGRESENVTRVRESGFLLTLSSIYDRESCMHDSFPNKISKAVTSIDMPRWMRDVS